MSVSEIILDTDIGYDPDDAIALLFLRKLAKISLIVTANETAPGHKRAQFVQTLLATLGDTDIPVVAGRTLGSNDKFTVDPLLQRQPDYTLPTTVTAPEAIKAVVDANDTVTYIGIGGFSNLADFVQCYPEDIPKLKAFIMGGALHYERYPGWVEYNVKIDPESVTTVLGAKGLNLTLIMAQTTHNPILEVTADTPIYELLRNSKVPADQMVAHHCDLWFKRRQFAHGTLMHDPLTVSTALGYDFTSLADTKVSMADQRFVEDTTHGSPIRYSLPESKATEFMKFLYATLKE